MAELKLDGDYDDQIAECRRVIADLEAENARLQEKLDALREKVLRPDKRLHQYEADIHQSDCGACELLAILGGNA